MGQLETTATELFGASFDLNEVVDCRIVRARVSVSGLAGAAAAAAIGLQPTWLTVVLADGRTLKAQARGAGPKKDAIEALGAELNARRASAAQEDLRRDRPTTFGPCVLSPTTFQRGKKSHRWDELVGYRVGEGYLQLDTARGLAMSVLLSAVPFGDALTTVVAEQLPGKDYDQLPQSQWPSFGFLTASAATHPGGTMTARGRVALLGGIAALGLAGAGGYLGWVWYEQNVVGPAEWATVATQRTEVARAFTRDDAAFFAPGLESCPKPNQDWSWAGPALVAQGEGVRSFWLFREGSWRKSDKLDGLPDHLYAWSVGPRGDESVLRVVKQKYKGPECRLAKALAPDEQGKAEEVARQLIDHSLPSLDLDAPPPASPEPAAQASAAPVVATKATKKKTTRTTKKPRKR